MPDTQTAAPTQALPARIAVIPTSHLDLFWLGDYRNCLRRGDDVIRRYLDRCVESDEETFVIDTVIFAQHFVENNPDYVPVVRRLLAEGRLEIGSAYIDHRENLVLGESLIRNVQIGRSWLRENLDVDARLAAHPDLPGIHAQTAQIYAKAGLRYYVTSRKIFQDGRVWRHRAPDGTAMTMLTWPMHYVFTPVDPHDIPEDAHGNFTHGRALSVDNLDERFPLGTVAIAGSAGDLTDPCDFHQRYGRDLRDYVNDYRRAYPQTTWEYSIPATVVQPYLQHPETVLAEVEGSIPSVWGVGSLEPMSLLHLVRANEVLLLAAEEASVLAMLRGRPTLPPEAAGWQGLFSEDAFFARSDAPPEGREFEWLWRMHTFSQDHNGGGQDGTLSTFQKKVRQDRIRNYANQVIDHAVKSDGKAGLAAFRTRLGASESLLILDGEAAEAARALAEGSSGQAVQNVKGADGRPRLAVASEPGSGVGYGPLVLANRTSSVVPEVDVEDDQVNVQTTLLSVSVARGSGEAAITDRRSGHVWRGINANVTAVPELGTSATLRVDEAARRICDEADVQVIGAGPLCTQVRIVRSFLEVAWTTVLTVWNDVPRVDVDLHVQWPGLENLQLRLPLVSGVPQRAVTYGTAFHGSRWDDLPDGANSGYTPDEVAPEDWANYREIQHWLHVAAADAGMTIATSHPAFFHDGQGLDAILFRTPPSGGDYRFHFANTGLTMWHFELFLGGADWAGAPELGERSWRRPIVRAGAALEKVNILSAEGGDVTLSALLPGPDGTVIARLVNQSGQDQHVRLTGAIVAAGAEVIDLDDNLLAELRADGGTLATTVAPWEIQTLRFAAR